MLMLTALASLGLDALGPVAHRGPKPIVDGAGVSLTRPMPSPPQDAHPRRGLWIWHPEGQSLPMRFFRRFEMASKPRKAVIWVSADVRYRLWVNGRLASRGPADVGRDYDSGAPGPWFDDVRDIASLLRKGTNTIAAEVFPQALVQSEGTSGRPGFKFDLACDGRPTLATDSSWTAAPAPDLVGWRGENGFTVDLRAEPSGWQTTGIGDVLAEADGPRPETIPSILPTLMEAVLPVTGWTRMQDATSEGSRVTFSKAGRATAKLGRVESAILALRIRGSAGTRLRVMPNEPDAAGFHRQAEIILRDGEQSVELPYLDSFSVVNLESTGPIERVEVVPIFTSFPVVYSGTFECDRPEWNRLWAVSRRVTQICLQTHHLDSPHHQEPISDPGDYLIQALHSAYAFREYRLARQDLQKYARILRQRDNKPFHTSYALLWLQMLVQHVMLSGDIALAKELAPDVRKLLDRFVGYIGPSGLVTEAPNYMFMDWVEIAGFNAHHPPAAIGQGYMSAFLARALEDDAWIADLVGDSDRARSSREAHRRLKEAFRRELWVEAAGLFRDGHPNRTSVLPNAWLPADRAVETMSTQVNALAVAYGLAPEGQAGPIMDRVMARTDLNCQPYFMHFVFDALAESGRFEPYAEGLFGRWKENKDTQSYPEMWQVGDLSHSWQVTPMGQLSRRVLGVVPLRPGFKVFEIAPKPLSLLECRGKVPTPHGLIDVQWTRKGGELRIDFRVPRGTQAVVGNQRFGAGRHVKVLPDRANH